MKTPTNTPIDTAARWAHLVDPLIGREGAYANHPDDRGGETMWGITIAVARRYGYTGPMRSMPRDTAAAIYIRRYLVEPGFDQVYSRSPAIAEELFDTGVNMGQAVASTMLQRALNALNRQGRDYPDLKVDGDVGPATLRALDAYLRFRGREGEAVLLKALNVLQGERYIDLAERRPANESFVYGWLRTRVEIPA